MAQTPEAKVKHTIKRWLNTQPNCWWYMPIGGPYVVHGAPDIIGCINGRFFGIEVKAPGKINNTTPNQRHQLAGIAAAGGIALVVDDVQAVVDAFVLAGLV